jgi:hypothetical protein
MLAARSRAAGRRRLVPRFGFGGLFDETQFCDRALAPFEDRASWQLHMRDQ